MNKVNLKVFNLYKCEPFYKMIEITFCSEAAYFSNGAVGFAKTVQGYAE